MLCGRPAGSPAAAAAGGDAPPAGAGPRLIGTRILLPSWQPDTTSPSPDSAHPAHNKPASSPLAHQGGDARAAAAAAAAAAPGDDGGQPGAAPPPALPPAAAPPAAEVEGERAAPAAVALHVTWPAVPRGDVARSLAWRLPGEAC